REREGFGLGEGGLGQAALGAVAIVFAQIAAALAAHVAHDLAVSQSSALALIRYHGVRLVAGARVGADRGRMHFWRERTRPGAPPVSRARVSFARVGICAFLTTASVPDASAFPRYVSIRRTRSRVHTRFGGNAASIAESTKHVFCAGIAVRVLAAA